MSHPAISIVPCRICPSPDRALSLSLIHIYVGIESIEGSFYNVMGLPVQKLYGELKEFCE